jgi:hypothetical protein
MMLENIGSYISLKSFCAYDTLSPKGRGEGEGVRLGDCLSPLEGRKDLLKE